MRARQREVVDTTLPRKTAWGVYRVSVPQTDSGGWGENPKAFERTLLQGTRQIDTVTSEEGVPSVGVVVQTKPKRVAKNRR